MNSQSDSDDNLDDSDDNLDDEDQGNADDLEREPAEAALLARPWPTDYSFEPELLGDAPRPVPAELRYGPYAHERRLISWFLLVFGMLSMGVSLLPVMKVWTEIFPPLAIVFWIGAAAAISAVFIQWRVDRGRFDYVRVGVPIVARIRSVWMALRFGDHDAVRGYVYKVKYEYIDPEAPPPDALDASNEPHTVTMEAESDSISTGRKYLVHMTLKTGDFATAVYLPGRVGKTIRLYALLGLRADIGVVDNVELRRATLAWVWFAFTNLFLFGLVMAWNVHVWFRYWPIEHPPGAFWFPLILGGAVFGGLQLLRMFWGSLVARLRPPPTEVFDEMNLDHVNGPQSLGEKLTVNFVGLALTVVLGAVTMLCWFVTANAWFDESQPIERAVTIDRSQRDDTSIGPIPLMRGAVLRGKFADGTPLSVQYPPHRWDEWKTNKGVAEVRAGWLGWTWIGNVRSEK